MNSYFSDDNNITEERLVIEEITQKISNARIVIAINHPFFGYLLSGMNIEVSSHPSLTIATDGYSVILSPNFFKTLTNAEILFVLGHEVVHCALEHIKRRKNRDNLLWNLAADIVTNELLIQNKLGSPPRGSVRVKDFISKYKNKGVNNSVEEIYKELLEEKNLPSETKNFDQHIELKKENEAKANIEKKEKGIERETKNTNEERSETKEKNESFKENNNQERKNSETEKSQTTSKRSTENNPSNTIEDIDRNDFIPSLSNLFKKMPKQTFEWNMRLSQAVVFAKSRGISPLVIEQEYEVSVKGFFPWQRLLSRLIQQKLAYDSNFSRPNRRYISRNLYLPAIVKSGLDVVVGIDTSGSISDYEAILFVSETFGILKQFPRINIHLIQCDAAIQKVQCFSNWDPPPRKFEIKGRGGTRFEPVFEYIIEKKIKVDALIYFTDGNGSFPKNNISNLEVFWVLTTRNVKVPFGYSIYFPPLNDYQ